MNSSCSRQGSASRFGNVRKKKMHPGVYMSPKTILVLCYIIDMLGARDAKRSLARLLDGSGSWLLS